MTRTEPTERSEELMQTYNSAVDAAEHMDCDPKCIRYAIKDGVTYRGYIWKYA